VHRSGKNRIFVNGSMVNINTLQAITASLVDLCSQHDQQLLAKNEEQLLWIDRFGELEGERFKVKGLYLKWRDKKASLEALSTDSAQRAQRIDFLRFPIQELEDAALSSPTEDQEIDQELKRLGNAEEFFGFAAEAEGLIYGSDASETTPMLDGLGALINKGRPLAGSDPKLQEAMDLLNNLKLHAEELGYFLRSYSQKVSRDENRLEELNARSALLAKLKRKYGPLLADVIEHLESFKQELSLLENHDSSLQEATEAASAALEDLRREATALSKKRRKAAKEFSAAVEKELAELNMAGAKFSASVQELGEPVVSGLDSARFEIAANTGETMGPMNKVASGGELSRIMLAMHNVVSSRSEVGVYLFDEVDAGIGGKTAVQVGAKLQKVARGNQVICITHLPQVAAFADQHFHVEKSVRKKDGQERTIASVLSLTESERELELARMLGGNGNDKAALANAKAMLEKARPVKGRPGAAPAKNPSGIAKSRHA